MGKCVASGVIPEAHWVIDVKHQYKGADKSLARPGRKQTTATKNFDIHISYLLS